jgi:hypothetical protein
MTPEPNSRMDGLLKRYAKKRCEEAAAPFEPHRVTKNSWQTEISRVYPQPRREFSTPGLWLRLAFASAVFLVVAISLALVQIRNERNTEMAKLSNRATPMLEPQIRQLRESASSNTRQLTLPDKDAPAEAKALLANATDSLAESDKSNTTLFASSGSFGEKAATPTGGFQLSFDGSASNNPSAANEKSVESLSAALKENNSLGLPDQEKSERAAVLATAISSTSDRKPEATPKQNQSVALLDAATTAPPAASSSLARSSEARPRLGDLAANKQQTPAFQTGTPASNTLVKLKSRQELALAKGDEITKKSEARAKAPLSETEGVSKDLRSRGFGLELQTNAPTGAVAATNSAPLYFLQNDNRAKYRRNLLSPPPPQVLLGFQFERNGNQIVIRDNDGSVYDGAISPTPTGRARLEGASDTFRFTAEGTNRVLGKPLSISGQFSPGTSGAGFGGATAAAETQPNGTIFGRVKIGATDEFQIRATQTRP